MANLKGCYLHNSDDWLTPVDLYKYFINNGYFDPCPFKANFDGLSIDWPEYVFINPPYSNIHSFVKKCIAEFEKDCYISVFLVPCRTDTKWFKDLWPYIHTIYFIHKRLKFSDSKLSAPFPSMLILCNWSPCFDKSISLVTIEDLLISLRGD